MIHKQLQETGKLPRSTMPEQIADFLKFHLTELTSHPRVQRARQVGAGRALRRGLLLLTKRRRDHPLVLLSLRLLLRVHAGLRLLRGRLRLLLLLVHHVLLLRLEMLLLLRLVLALLWLHVGVLRVHLVVHLRLDQRRAVRSIEHATLVIDRGRLKLATRVHDRGGRMPVRGRRVPHVAHAGAGRRRPVPTHPVHAPVVLLVLIIRRVTHVHPIVGRKPRIRHILLTARRPIMVAGHALAQEAGVARVAGLLGLLLHRLRLLGHLDGRTVVLLMLMRVFHPAITQVRDVRIREVRTHATVPPGPPSDSTSLPFFSLFSFSFFPLLCYSPHSSPLPALPFECLSPLIRSGFAPLSPP